MTVLSQLAGLPIGINEEVEDLFYDEDHVDCNSCGVIKLKDISRSLLNPALIYPEKIYKHHKHMKLKAHSTSWPGEYIYDVIYLPDGLLGIEYIKTHIFKAADETKAACVVQVFSGELKVLLQKNKPKADIYDIHSHVEEAIVVDLKAGEKASIPGGYYYTFVNTSSDPTAFARLVKQEHELDYAELKRECGLAYYLIAKNARPEVVVNSRYRTVPELQNFTCGDINERCGYTPDNDRPLYQEALDNVEELAAILS